MSLYYLSCHCWMSFKWFNVCFPWSTHSFFCCKIVSYMQCYFFECFHKIFQTKPNIVVLEIKLCNCFYFHGPLLSLKVKNINSGMFSIRPSDSQSVYLSFSQCVTQSGLWVSAKNYHILTIDCLKKTNTDFEITGQSNKFIHSVSLFF